MQALSWRELQIVAARLIGERPAEDETETISDTGSAITINGGAVIEQ